MVITLGNIVFGGKGNGGSSTASAYVVPNGMRFQNSTFETFSSEGLDFSQKTDFSYCWDSCSNLTEFPMIDTSQGTDFRYTWYSCNKLTTFPMVDVSGGTNFYSAWRDCKALVSFPSLNFQNGTNFNYTWNGCSALTTIGQLDLSNGTSFTNAWSGCSSLTTLGGFGKIKASFDLSDSTVLTADSMMNIINQAADLNELGIAGKKMTLGSDNLAKLSDEQKAVATSKGWTLA